MKAIMDSAASMPPEQDRRTRLINKGQFPPEIIEEILLNLPVKSLVRFTSVSKWWHSTIFGSGFIRKHKTRAALRLRHRIVINPDYDNTTCFCAISSISSDQPIGIVIEPQNAGNASFCSISNMFRHQPTVEATDFALQFQGKPCLYAFCDELWCVGVENSLFLWNPSMRIYRKLPDPLFQYENVNGIGIGIGDMDENGSEVGLYNRYDFVYGLEYDSVADDYKILKILRMNSLCSYTELYSLKSNCWRKIESYSAKPIFPQERCEFVDGMFHWLGHSNIAAQPIIVSFNLSTEKYGEVVEPEYFPVPNLVEDGLEVVVVRGMLCACVNYCRDTRFVLWVMEEYGVEKSWTKKFDIQYSSSLPYFPAKVEAASCFTLKPLYFYDNNDILIKVSTDNCHLEIFKYKNEEAIPMRIASCGKCNNTSDAFLYVESLVSPAVPVVGCNE